MSTQLNAALPRNRAASSNDLPPRRIPLLLRVMTGVWMGLAVCLCCIVIAAHKENAPRIVEPPLYLLPNHPPPTNIFCDTAFDRHFRCRADVDGEEIYLTTDPTTEMIVHTTISASKQTIWNLVAAWDSPTAVGQYGQGIYIYWGTRYAYLSTCSLEPGSHIDFIGYGLGYNGFAQQELSPWRGFIRDVCKSSGNAYNQ